MTHTRVYTRPERRGVDQRQLRLQHISLQLAALGLRCDLHTDQHYLSIADSLLKNYSQHRRLLAEYRCPADQRIQTFLQQYLQANGIADSINLPGETFSLNQKGLARELSLPLNEQAYQSDLVESYRVRQGVLHNPHSDRRTTKGVFHIVEGGLPIPFDKRAVPVPAYVKLLQAALQPPDAFMELPLSSDMSAPVHTWVSLLLRPMVVPEIAGLAAQKSMETRVFAPGGLVSNLDFLETIFGNAGDPFLPEQDAALDLEHWTGHTGGIILAPHLVGVKKIELGLPHYDQADARQRRDGMCWKQRDELYNDGQAFKVVCRDMSGVVVTIIADNYFGYSKKEVKSQISYAANLYGGSEEEHAGGALAFPRFNLGDRYIPEVANEFPEHTYERLCQQLQGGILQHPEGCATDLRYPDIIYIPESASIELQEMRVCWPWGQSYQEIPLRAGTSYVYPSGFKVHAKKHPHAPSWRLIGTLGEGTFCHKPSTVSGGGKSEISKSIQDSMISGPLFVNHFDEDMDQVEQIVKHDFQQRFIDPGCRDDRGLFSSRRSLGSVIKLLTPSSTDYTAEYNQWLAAIPHHVLALTFMIKRFYKPEWGDNWRRYFSVDEINGHPGNELKYRGRKLATSHLRVGSHQDGTWRIYKLRQDFVASEKVQMEDDITASVVVPCSPLRGLPDAPAGASVKLTGNCEQRLFQRPDEAIHRGLDRQTEADLAGSDNFISNFQPLLTAEAQALVNDVMRFDAYTAPMQKLLREAAQADPDRYVVSSAHPRLVNGKPSPNVRYLQPRPDIANPRQYYLACVGMRLARGLSLEEPLQLPVDAVLQGRRNNPAELKTGIRPLAVYNPIHYQELPELFMDLICSLTGKSPSTTGAGSEGALTKGPFNALSATADLNNALVSFILCEHAGFSSAAGHIGHKRRIDHDISMLIPEIWCRIPSRELAPEKLIGNGYFEKLEDFEHQGNTVHASRLGYRMTEKFVHAYFGKVFDNPTIVFDTAMLEPESQDLDSFVDGINNIVEAQQRVALQYFEDDSIANACPPLKGLLHIMAYGEYQGKGIDDAEFRNMFNRDYLLGSDWYQQRLKIKQQRDLSLWTRHEAYLVEQLRNRPQGEGSDACPLQERLAQSRASIEQISSAAYLAELHGSLGADWIEIRV